MIPPVKRHSFEQKRWLERRAIQILGGERVSRSHCYLVLAELAQHGLPVFSQLCERLAELDKDQRLASMRSVLSSDFSAAIKVLKHSGVRLSTDQERSLLHPMRPVFIPSANDGSPLVVVFTTSYNNFYFSNTVIAALLMHMGFSCLFLKDGTGYQYLAGIPGFGKNWRDSIENLRKFLEKNASERRIIFSGFSSGGFAAVLAAERIGADHAVGFSIRSTMSRSSHFPRSKLITDEMYSSIPQELQVDLETVLQGKEIPVSLYCGQESPYDLAHTMALADLSNVKFRILQKTSHISVRPLMMEGTLAHAMAAIDHVRS